MEIELKANLFIPGVGKSGTSSLHSYLNQHPEISMSKMKEPQFFCMDERFRQGFEYYNSLFDYKEGAKYYGESSTSYIGSEIAVELIKKYIKVPKFIILLRNPIDRIYSHYTWLVALGKEYLPFKKAIIDDMDSVFNPNNPIDGIGFKNYYFFSRYGTLVKKYISEFGRENVHIITTERLKYYPLDTLNGCFSFLNLPVLAQIEEKEENVTEAIQMKETPLWMKKLGHYVPASIKNQNSFKRVIVSTFARKYKPAILSADDRQWIYGLLKDEVNELKLITNLKFPEWEDFA